MFKDFVFAFRRCSGSGQAVGTRQRDLNPQLRGSVTSKLPQFRNWSLLLLHCLQNVKFDPFFDVILDI